jgi:hypothetical protein
MYDTHWVSFQFTCLSGSFTRLSQSLPDDMRLARLANECLIAKIGRSVYRGSQETYILFKMQVPLEQGERIGRAGNVGYSAGSRTSSTRISQEKRFKYTRFT